MCSRFAMNISADLFTRFFRLTGRPEPDLLHDRYNIAPSQMVPVVRQSAGHRSVSMLKWGLIPPWAEDPRVGSRMINARMETVFEKPSFQQPIRMRRCLVPAVGFYEWVTLQGRKQPMLIRLRSGDPLAFAGIWETWTPQPKQGALFGHNTTPVETFSILTTTPNSEVAPIHNRMPVTIAPEHFDTWLDTDKQEAREFGLAMLPARNGIFKITPVNPLLNNPRNEGENLWNPPSKPSQST